MRKLVSMNEDGRITVPRDARRRFGIVGGAEFEVEVTDDSIVLTPAVVMPLGDAWAYTSDHRKLLERAHADSRKGRVKRLDESELADLADHA